MVKSRYKNTCDGAAVAVVHKYIANVANTGLEARENQNQGSIEGNKGKQCSQQSRDLKMRQKKKTSWKNHYMKNRINASMHMEQKSNFQSV